MYADRSYKFHEILPTNYCFITNVYVFLGQTPYSSKVYILSDNNIDGTRTCTLPLFCRLYIMDIRMLDTTGRQFHNNQTATSYMYSKLQGCNTLHCHGKKCFRPILLFQKQMKLAASTRCYLCLRNEFSNGQESLSRNKHRV